MNRLRAILNAIDGDLVGTGNSSRYLHHECGYVPIYSQTRSRGNCGRAGSKKRKSEENWNHLWKVAPLTVSTTGCEQSIYDAVEAGRHIAPVAHFHQYAPNIPNHARRISTRLPFPCAPTIIVLKTPLRPFRATKRMLPFGSLSCSGCPSLSAMQ